MVRVRVMIMTVMVVMVMAFDGTTIPCLSTSLKGHNDDKMEMMEIVVQMTMALMILMLLMRATARNGSPSRDQLVHKVPGH